MLLSFIVDMPHDNQIRWRTEKCNKHFRTFIQLVCDDGTEKKITRENQVDYDVCYLR